MIAVTMPCRNEDWIIGLSARAALMWCDHLIVLDHCSTDSTPEILIDLAGEYPSRVTVLNERNPVWEEMRHRQRLLDTARGLGASHVCLIDSDEVLTGDLLPSIRGFVEHCPAGQTMQLPWLCLRGSKDLVHRSGVWGEQNVSMGFKDAPGLGWESASRGGYDFHQRAPMGRAFAGYRPIQSRSSGLMHLQFVSDRRLRAKQALYQATEVLRWPGRETPDQIRKKYSLSVYGHDHPPVPGDRDFDLSQCPAAWWQPYAHLMSHYRPDAEPWQEATLKALVAEHGAAKFAGLDFFGVC